MSRTRVRQYTTEEPSRAEKAATRWHQVHHSGAPVDCWCCCRPCRTANPHHVAARVAASADITARVNAVFQPLPLPERAVN